MVFSFLISVSVQLFWSRQTLLLTIANLCNIMYLFFKLLALYKNCNGHGVCLAQALPFIVVLFHSQQMSISDNGVINKPFHTVFSLSCHFFSFPFISCKLNPGRSRVPLGEVRRAGVMSLLRYAFSADAFTFNNIEIYCLPVKQSKYRVYIIISCKYGGWLTVPIIQLHNSAECCAH